MRQRYFLLLLSCLLFSGLHLFAACVSPRELNQADQLPPPDDDTATPFNAALQVFAARSYPIETVGSHFQYINTDWFELDGVEVKANVKFAQTKMGVALIVKLQQRPDAPPLAKLNDHEQALAHDIYLRWQALKEATQASPATMPQSTTN